MANSAWRDGFAGRLPGGANKALLNHGNVYDAKKKTVEYLDEEGVSPFSRWFAKIDSQAALKVRRSAARMELGNRGDSKGVGEGVLECRINFGPGCRIYYGRDGEELAILRAGGTKKRQQADIERAKGYWSEYKTRKETK